MPPTPPPTSTPASARWLAAGWLLAVVVCMGALTGYTSAPGAAARPAAAWPGSAPLPHVAGQRELLLFAHALCPCTRASLSELERILPHAPDDLRCRVILWTDPGNPAEFSRSDLRTRAAGMAGVELVEDPAGRVAGGFGCRTSGTALLYDADGRLLFSGGLTPARGHEGDSIGKSALLDLLGGGPARHDVAPVFGCPLEAGTTPAEPRR